jgi:hypothetical protein
VHARQRVSLSDDGGFGSGQIMKSLFDDVWIRKLLSQSNVGAVMPGFGFE